MQDETLNAVSETYAVLKGQLKLTLDEQTLLLKYLTILAMAADLNASKAVYNQFGDAWRNIYGNTKGMPK